MGFLGFFEAMALDATCDVETGPYMATVTTEDLPCRQIPPEDEDDDITTAFLLKDTNGKASIGGRIVFDSARYLIQKMARDGVYVRCQCKEWFEE